MKKHIPYRKCIGCMESKPQAELLRVILDDRRVVKLDDSGNMPGRGAYMCKSQDCLDKAIKRRSFSRSFRGEASTELIEQSFKELDCIKAKGN